MKIQAITVSVNYSDFLIHTLEENKELFDKWVIITDTEDNQTKELCIKYEKYGVTCIQTDIFYVNAKFNKFAGINEGLKYIDKDAWVLFLDSDIVLHSQTRRVLENIELNKKFIYGIDRFNCIGREKWEDYKISRDLVINNWLLTDAGLVFGSRLVHYYGYEGGNGKFAGWNPIGFFQLAHKSAFTNYPQKSIGADHCDLMFSRQWPRSYRVMIPELMAIHLESKFVVKGVNWYGRLSQPFTINSRFTLKYLFRLIMRKITIMMNSVKRNFLY